jgi:hypothetical protein
VVAFQGMQRSLFKNVKSFRNVKLPNVTVEANQEANIVPVHSIVFRAYILVYIVTCRGLCVTYKTGFGLDDWIY